MVKVYSSYEIIKIFNAKKEVGNIIKTFCLLLSLIGLSVAVNKTTVVTAPVPTTIPNNEIVSKDMYVRTLI